MSVFIIGNYLGRASDVFRMAIDNNIAVNNIKEFISNLLNNLNNGENDLTDKIINFIKKAKDVYEYLPYDDKEFHEDLLELNEKDIRKILMRVKDKDLLRRTFESILLDLIGEVETL